MDSKEAAYAKQGVLATCDWDVFQVLMRGFIALKVAVDKRRVGGKILFILASLAVFQLISLGQAQAMTRTLKTEPAIVIAAFGTTTRAQATYDYFAKQLLANLPAKFRGYKVAWAFTSEIVRERANKKFKAEGKSKRYLSLPQTLANLQDEGYRKIALQPLHIFPGQEYDGLKTVVTAFGQMGLRIEYGGSLLHEWPWLFEAIGVVEQGFLKPEEGCNVIVVHGSPQTFRGSNSTYLGLDRYISGKYKNVFVGGVDGILTREQALSKAKAYRLQRVRFIPFMYVAGDHIMNDIMGDTADDKGQVSWAMEMKAAGMQVDTLHTNYKGQDFFKGLGFYEKIDGMLIGQLLESLERLEND